MVGGRLPALTTLRFAAAALIVLVHSYGLFGLPAHQPGGITFVQAVSFFFVLSGFVLAYAHPTLDGGAWRFLATRATRLWPAHLVAFAIFVHAFPFTLPGRERYGTPWDYTLLNLTLTHAWVPRFHSFFSYNDVTWTISCEWLFALCFPLLLARTPRGWLRTLGATFALVVATVALANSLHAAHRIAGDFATEGVGTLGLVYINPLARLFEFTCGMALCALWRAAAPRIRVGRATATAAEVAALALAWWEIAHVAGALHRPLAYRALGYAGVQWVIVSGGGVPAFALVIFVFACGRGWVSRLLALRPLVFLGEISYAIYLTHHIAIRYIGQYPQRVQATDLRSYVAFWFVVLAASSAIYLLIERPAVRVMRRLLPPVRGAPQSVGRSPLAVTPGND